MIARVLATLVMLITLATLNVEVSDQGIRWGEATIEAEVRAGKLHTFHETAFNVRLGS